MTASTRAVRSRCGVYDCRECVLFREACPGCASGNLRLARRGEEPCAVYQCVRGRGVVGCWECRAPKCGLRRSPTGRREGRPALRCLLRQRFGDARENDAFGRSLAATKGLVGSPAGARGSPERRADRLRAYLTAVEADGDHRPATVTSHHLGLAAGVRASLVRRDISALGASGTPGRGYQVAALRSALGNALHLSQTRAAVWLGGIEGVDWPALKEALAAVNCHLVGVFDDDRRKARPPRARRANVGGLRVEPLARAAELVRRRGASVAVVASADAAEPGLVRELAAAGVRGILNLTGAPVRGSALVAVEQGDIASQLVRLFAKLGADANRGDG